MKSKIFEICILPVGYKHGDDWGTFQFKAENKKRAHAHVMRLKNDREFRDTVGKPMVSDNVYEPVRHIAVRFVGYSED